MIIYFGKQIFSRFVFTTVSIHVINIKVFCRRRIYQFGVPFVALATIFFLGLTTDNFTKKQEYVSRA